MTATSGTNTYKKQVKNFLQNTSTTVQTNVIFGDGDITFTLFCQVSTISMNLTKDKIKNTFCF